MPLFTEFAFLVVAAAVIAILTRLIRQPLVIGYIITGVIVGPVVLNVIQSAETLRLLSELGVSFLLFIVGLNLTPKVIREVGGISFLTGIGQMVVTSAAGFYVAKALGFTTIASAYLGVALAFSSTIIIMKLLTDRGDLEKPYGKISIGYLLVQDLIAILLLLIIPLLSKEGVSLAETTGIFLRGLIIAAVFLFVAHRIFPRLDRFFGNSLELRFLSAIAWGLGAATLFRYVGFSLESGALIAGVSLAELPSRHEISARLRPLRDFFIVLFFILLGSQMALTGVSDLIRPAIILSLLVILGNPLILMSLMGALGYRKRTSFQTGLTTAQISEFSLILVAMGVGLGHVTQRELSLTTLVGVATIFASTYLILYSDRLYHLLAPYLGIIERQSAKEQEIEHPAYEFVLFGYNRIGYDFLDVFRNSGRPFLVVDYDPLVIDGLRRRGVSHAYGDAKDIDFLHSLPLGSIRLAVSTIPDRETNLLILRAVRGQSPAASMMAVAHSISDAFSLYEGGVDYVIMPHFLGGAYAARITERAHHNPSAIAAAREEHLSILTARQALGHEHPRLTI